MIWEKFVDRQWARKVQFQTQNQLKTKNETHILGREIGGKIQLLLAYFIDEIRVFEVGIFVVEDSCRRRW